MKKFARLRCIENNEKICWDDHQEFLYNLQHALLLVLFERGRLDMSQLQRAEKNLQDQRRERLKRSMQCRR